MKTIYALSAIYLAVLFLITGNGLFTTLIPLRAKLEHFDPLIIGLFGAAYFGGMLAGTVLAARMVRYGGYVRSFAVLCALTSSATLGFSLALNPWLWLVLRAVQGFCFAGLYAVVESWLNSRASNTNRGHIYGIYQNISFAATALGQSLIFLDDPHAGALFVIAALFIGLAVVPLYLTRTEPPAPPRAVVFDIGYLWRVSPIGAVGALTAGLTNGAYWTLGPVYALGIGLAPEQVPWFSLAVVFGSVIGIYPLAIISDRMDRRLVLIGTTLVCAAFDGCLWQFTDARGGFLSLFAAGLGATTMSIYTLSMSQTNDRADPQRLVLVSSGMLFLYCVGAMVAPTVAAHFMETLGSSALFGENMALHILYGAFVIYRTAFVKRLPVMRHEANGKQSEQATPPAGQSPPLRQI